MVGHECFGRQCSGGRPAAGLVEACSGWVRGRSLILLLGVDVIWLIKEGAEWYPVMFGAGVTLIGVGITIGEPPPQGGRPFPAHVGER